MQKWEYGVYIEINTRGAFGVSTEQKWQGTTVKVKFHDFLNQLGAQGWELVTSHIAVGVGDNKSTWEYIFKRPIE